MAGMDRQQEFVLRTLEERDIRFVRLWFTDVTGYLKAVAVAPAEIEAAFAEGIGFDGSAIEGFARVYESDMLAKPDPGTFQVMPAAKGQPSDTARMFCDITLPDGSPSWADPRHVLRRALAKAADMGFTFYTHPAVEFCHHEVSPGQQEIDLRYADALSMADNIMTLRHVVREVALAQGVHATFMPKPFTDLAGSAMHTHLSLFEGDRNAFHDAADPMRLSATAKQFIAGILTHAREFTAITNQTVNSYRRLLAGTEAPTAATWGRANRSALLRLPAYKPSKAQSARVEIRSPDSACNPYLTFAVLLAAGLRGIEKGYELPPEAEDDVWSLTDTERRAAGDEDLPEA